MYIPTTCRTLALRHPTMMLALLSGVLRFSGYELRVIDPALPIHAALATNFYRLRDQIFAEKYQWEEPQGLERDRYDRAAKFIVVIRDGQVVAGCRIIHRSLLSGPLPMEETLDAAGRMAINPSTAVEISRMINSSGSRLIFDALHLKVRQYLKHGGLEAFASTRRDYLEQKLDRKFGAEHFPRLSGSIKKRTSKQGSGKDEKVKSYEFVPHRIVL